MAQSISTKALAYLGDAVFELLVRSMLIKSGTRNLNKKAKEFVSATAQSDIYHKIFPLLEKGEQALCKRGRNIKTSNTAEYRHATGIEVLFGSLYAEGKHDRLKEIFEMCIK